MPAVPPPMKQKTCRQQAKKTTPPQAHPFRQWEPKHHAPGLVFWEPLGGSRSLLGRCLRVPQNTKIGSLRKFNVRARSSLDADTPDKLATLLQRSQCRRLVHQR
jgi:hypothetical protein